MGNTKYYPIIAGTDCMSRRALSRRPVFSKFHSGFPVPVLAPVLEYLTNRGNASGRATYELRLGRTENPGVGGPVPAHQFFQLVVCHGTSHQTPDCAQLVPNSRSLQPIRAHVEGILDGGVLHAYTPAKSRTSFVGRTMSLRSLGLLVTLALGLLVAPLAADAQQAGKVPRIGWLGLPGQAGNADIIGGFREGLRQLGYTEGKNITIEYRFADGRAERLSNLAVELVGLHVDAIVVTGSQAATAAKHATATIPIVMVSVGDPVAIGLIASLAKPGGNVTGLSAAHGDISA